MTKTELDEMIAESKRLHELATTGGVWEINAFDLHSRTALPALVAEVERLQRVVDEIQGWNQVAAESNKAIDAFLREIDPDMPEHYGMPVDGIMQVVHKLRSGIESAFKEGFRAGYDAELDTNIESEWQWSDSAASVSAELKAREK